MKPFYDFRKRFVPAGMSCTPLTAEIEPDRHAVPTGLIIPIANIAPGSYIAQITVRDESGRQFTRRVVFDVLW